MKKLLLCTAIMFALSTAFAQDEITKGNTCYSKFEFQCTIDNYLIALEKKSFKEGDRHLLEYRIGDSYDGLGQPEKAKEYLQKAIATKPEYFLSYWAIADIFYDAKNYTDAVSYYQKAFDRAIEKKDKDDLTWWIATTMYDAKNYTAAINEFRKIPGREGKFKKTESYMGDAFYTLKKYDSALVYYARALDNYKNIDSTIKVIKTFMGKCYSIQGKYKEANEQLDAALAIDAKYGLPIWEKGIIFASKKEYPSAIEWYKKALPYYTAKPTDSYVLCGNISACYQYQDNYTEAVNWEIKRKAFSSNKYKDYQKIASLQYGKLNQPKDAEKTCAQGINEFVLEPADKLKTLSNDDYVKLNALAGKIALERKDTVQAMQYFETALKLNKNNFEANAGAAAIAWARKKEADYKKYYANIYKTTYDTLISSKKDIANVYGRAAYTDAYVNKYTYYSSGVETALKFDSLQKESVLLWPVVLTTGPVATLNSKRNACLSILNQAIKFYAADKSYVSDVYNTKAVVLDSKDTTAIKKALDEAVKIYPENIRAWDNLMKYYASYDNNAGSVTVEKLISILKKQKDNASTASAYVYKGDFLWRMEKKDDAKKAWQEALVWDSNNATAKERVKMQ